MRPLGLLDLLLKFRLKPELHHNVVQLSFLPLALEHALDATAREPLAEGGQSLVHHLAAHQNQPPELRVPVGFPHMSFPPLRPGMTFPTNPVTPPMMSEI